MDWTEALDLVISRTGHERYRSLCDGDHPHHAIWRRRIVDRATGVIPTPPAPAHLKDVVIAGSGRPMPPLAAQAGNLGRALWDWAVSGFSMASDEERARRAALCEGCPQFERGRCRLCGCHLAAKIRMRAAHCPLPEPRW